MADKGWTARIATAAGAAAGTGAAQLGLGYGLGVVVWPVTPTADDSAWLGSLGWATWITASATVFGAVLGSRYRGGPGPRTTAAWRFALAAFAAVGALVTVALIALPARSAVRLDTFAPQVVAAGYAAVGLLFGLVVAFWAVSSRPVAANLMATGAWLWALAVTAVVVDLATDRASATYLTSWQFAEVASSGRYGTIYWPSALLTLAAAFLVGALAAAPAARRGDLGTGAATSGAAGPLLVAVAFLALAPRLTGALGPIESAYLIAPYAVLAGLAGSALAVAGGRALTHRRSRRSTAAPATDSPDADTTDPRSLDADDRDPRGHDGDTTDPRRLAADDRDPRRPDADDRDPRGLAAGADDSRTDAGTRDAAAPVVRATKAGAGTSRPGVAKVPEQPAPPPRTNGKPAAVPVTDAEIASAARPRPRLKKAPKSTVTPPPQTPTVARINPPKD